MYDTVLDRIKAYKLEEIKVDKVHKPLSTVESVPKAAITSRGVYDRLLTGPTTGYGFIVVIKKASPSKGLIRTDFDPEVLAKDFEEGGATCLSVLTDTPSFQGNKDYLAKARQATSLPALRKDFIYDIYQVAEARALGADCILIILASTSDAQAIELEEAAFSWGMDVLIEVHDEGELERAAELKSPIIGINNRNLKTFETTLSTTRDLSRRVPEGRLIVSESGLTSQEHLADMAAYGARCFLIGESLMRKENVRQATQHILANPIRGDG